MLRLVFFFTLAIVSCGFAGKQDSAASSHMVGNDRFDGDLIINEVRVPKNGEAKFTYYEALGWRGLGGGYAGIQAHPRGHNFIFSIWDNKAHKTPIKAIHHGPGTETKPFGGEGTGLKSWNFKLDWATDTWQTLVARTWLVGDNTQYGFWVRKGDTQEWTHLVTMEVAAPKAYFRGSNDSFLEDWLSTGKTNRTSHLRNGWKRKLDGIWFPITKMRYSVNKWDLVPGKRSYNYRTSWDGGIAKDATGPYFYMSCGGDLKPTTENPSSFTIPQPNKAPDYPSIAVTELTAAINDGKLTASWQNNPTTLPQFSYSLKIFDNETGTGTPKVADSATIPHFRTHTLDVSKLDLKTPHYLHLICTDVLDGTSKTKVVQIK